MKNDTIKLLLIFTPALFGSFPALANVSGGDWKPQIVEKMFVLPPQHLNKVLNNDFKTSVLALNLRDTDNKIKSKKEEGEGKEKEKEEEEEEDLGRSSSATLLD